MRKLKWQFINTPATTFELLGVPRTPTVREVTTNSNFGQIIRVGPWAFPRTNQTPEIYGISEISIPWQLRTIDQ